MNFITSPITDPGEISQQKLAVKKLCGFDTWIGVGATRTLWIVYVVFTTVFSIFNFARFLSYGGGWIAVALLVVPIVWFVSIVEGKVLAEAIMSVLLIPYYAAGLGDPTNGVYGAPRVITEAQEIPRQQVAIGKLFNMSVWQGVGWARWLYFVAFWVSSLLLFITFVVMLASGNGYAIAVALIVLPIMWVLLSLFIRVAVEAMIVALLLPTILATIARGGHAAPAVVATAPTTESIPQPTASYGVGV